MSVVDQALLLTIVWRFLSLPLSAMPMTAVSGNYRFLRTEFRTETYHRCSVVKEDFHL
jgi:hypothetical protein